ncbi:MAG: hypothetical protein O3A95_03205 [Planctomycetota bacterium]|nr:hypothetical protein [Planctomycetota bacterium]MDA1113289.1 hypothetical protein [Planctomycetota bacterium]
MAKDSEPNRQGKVVVLVSEDFFRDWICTTLEALGRVAIRLEPGDDLLNRVLATNCLGVVVDLEDQKFDGPEVLKGVRASEKSADWTIMSFCSYEDEERMAKVTALGLTVTPRSTFALNLVRKLQEFGADGEADS